MAKDLTPTELADANAQGMTPAEYEAAYAGQGGQSGGSAPKAAAPAITAVDEKTAREQGRTTGAQFQDVAAELKSEAPESAYEQLANAQAEQYLAMTKEIDPLTSGAALPAINANMSKGAEAMLGQGGNSAMSQWLNQQTGAAASQYAPVLAAGQQVAGAQDRAAQMEATGIEQMGQAETAEMQAAPYEQLLQSLAQEVPYHLSQNYPFPGLTGQNVPAFLQGAEKYVGVNTTGQGTGTGGIPGSAGSRHRRSWNGRSRFYEYCRHPSSRVLTRARR